jgi:hypothetical protein
MSILLRVLCAGRFRYSSTVFRDYRRKGQVLPGNNSQHPGVYYSVSLQLLVVIGVAAVVAAPAVVTIEVERKHVITYGHRIPYGWHVDLATVVLDPRSSMPHADPSGGIVVPEEGQWATILNFSLIPGVVESCEGGTRPLFAATPEKWDEATKEWRRLPGWDRPQCLNSPIRARLIWPLQSFSTKPIPFSKIRWFQEGDLVRIVALSKWDRTMPPGHEFASAPFRVAGN